jgi:hypothetical protein
VVTQQAHTESVSEPDKGCQRPAAMSASVWLAASMLLGFTGMPALNSGADLDIIYA